MQMTDAAVTPAERRERLRHATLAAIRRQETDIARWDSLGQVWSERAQAAAALVPAGRRVLDLGCGGMAIEPLLPAGTVYVPLDVCRRDERTIVVDLNVEPLPQVPADYLLGMGVLEYLFDIPAFLAQAAAQFDDGLVSYHPLERKPQMDRFSNGWVNALNTPELLALFRGAGFGHVTVIEHTPSLHFYVLAKDGDAISR